MQQVSYLGTLRIVRRFPVLTLPALLIAMIGPGCSSPSGPEKVGVSGSVSVDGEPVDEGTIAFVSLDGGRTAATRIADGSYSIARSDGPFPGRQKVVIQAHRKTGKVITVDKTLPAPPGENADIPPGGLKIKETEPILPARYNSESELRVELDSGYNRNVDFDLTLDASESS